MVQKSKEFALSCVDRTSHKNITYSTYIRDQGAHAFWNVGGDCVEQV